MMKPEHARHYLGKIAKVFSRYHSTEVDQYASGTKHALKSSVEEYESFFVDNKLLTQDLSGVNFAVPTDLPKLTQPLIDAINAFTSIQNEKLQLCLRTDFFHAVISEVGKLSEELTKNKNARSELSSAKISFNKLAKLLKRIPQCFDQELSESLDDFLVDFGHILKKDKAFKKLIKDRKLFQVAEYKMQIPADLGFLPKVFLTLVRLRAEFQSNEVLKTKSIMQGNFKNLHAAVYSVYYLCALVREKSKDNKKGRAKLEAASAIAAALRTGEKDGDKGLVFVIGAFYRLMVVEKGSSRSIDIILAEAFRVLTKKFHEDEAIGAAASVLHKHGGVALYDAVMTSAPVASTDGSATNLAGSKKGRGRGVTLFGHNFPGTAAADDESSESEDEKASSASTSATTSVRVEDDAVAYEAVATLQFEEESDSEDSDANPSSPPGNDTGTVELSAPPALAVSPTGFN